MNKKAKEKVKENIKAEQGNDISKEKNLRVKFSIKYKVSLAIITLVSIIIASFTGYFIWSESKLLEKQVFQFIKREVVHLANTTQGAIGIDELALISAINDIKQFDYIKYAYILGKEDPTKEKTPLNRDNAIIHFFNVNKKYVIGSVLADSIDRSVKKDDDINKIKIQNYPDPIDKSGVIHDFSKVVINKFDKRQIATVVIGLSDIVIRNEIKNMIRVIVPLSLGILVISIIGSILLAAFIIKPIKIITHGATIIGQGNLDHRIVVKSNDELGRLASEFNEMTKQIQEAKDKEIESRIMEEQLEMAKDIQEGLNPMGYYNKNGVQIKGFTRAAKGVGGDYFDYIDIDENKVGALISDVSGKGVPASLVMVMIRTVFTTYISRSGVDCSQVVSAINDSLSADFAIDKFATLFFMIYDRSTGELAFSNAGHGPLFLYRASLKACSNTKLEGVPIGIMEDVVYKQGKVKLELGDMVVLYTDGVTEMRNAKKEEYGIKRVRKFILENNKMNAEQFVDLLVKDVDDFKGDVPPHDDETLLVLKRE